MIKMGQMVFVNLGNKKEKGIVKESYLKNEESYYIVVLLDGSEVHVHEDNLERI